MEVATGHGELRTQQPSAASGVQLLDRLIGLSSATVRYWLLVLCVWWLLRWLLAARAASVASSMWLLVGAAMGCPIVAWGARRVSMRKQMFAGLAPPPAKSVDELTELINGQTEQRLRRGRDAEGVEWIAGQVRVLLPVGQRSAHLHVAICPPFARAPHVEVEQLAGPVAELRVGLTLPQGIRLDVKRGGPVEHEGVLVLEFYGSGAA